MENFDFTMLLALPVLLFSICVHETAHALVAFWGGDDTASLQGRVTLNPLAHIDPLGTIIIPVLGVLLPQVPLIGWAKPVPVNPMRLKNSTWSVYVAMAGPASNFLLAIIFIILLTVLMLVLPNSLFGRGDEFGVGDGLLLMAQYGILINLLLGFFNLIPLPPLDGHWFVGHYFVRPGNWIDQFYTAIMPYSYMALMMFIFIFGEVFFGAISFVFGLIMSLIYMIAL